MDTGTDWVPDKPVPEPQTGEQRNVEVLAEAQKPLSQAQIGKRVVARNATVSHPPRAHPRGTRRTGLQSLLPPHRHRGAQRGYAIGRHTGTAHAVRSLRRSDMYRAGALRAWAIGSQGFNNRGPQVCRRSCNRASRFVWVQHQGQYRKERHAHLPRDGRALHDQTRINTSKGGAVVLLRERGTSGGMAPLEAVVRIPTVPRTDARAFGVTRSRGVDCSAPRSVPDISRDADATLLETVHPDSRPEERPG